MDGDGASRQSATAKDVVSAGAARGRSLQLVKLEQADSAAHAIFVGQRVAAVGCQRRSCAASNVRLCYGQKEAG